jgi:hypothetical protein
MYPGREPAPRQAQPTTVTHAPKWLVAAVESARNPSRGGEVTATVNVPVVETPILTPTHGAMVTILEWRLSGVLRDALTLTVTLLFAPISVKSASVGALQKIC